MNATKNAKKIIGTLAVLVLLSGGPALAVEPSEAYGQVVDREGEPVKGALVKFTPKLNPALTYDSKTNKKGKYFAVGLFASQGDKWLLAVEVEGMVPVEMTVESRTVNRVLVDEIYTQQLKPGAPIPAIIIRPMGKARVDFVVAPESEVAAAIPVAPSGEMAVVAEQQQAPTKDAWQEALGRAAANDFAGSVELFTEAVEDDPDDPVRHETFAKVLYQLERLEEAEAEIRKAVELAPDNANSRMILYSIQMSAGDEAGARETLLAAREVLPRDLRILEQIAYLANERGDTAEAIEAYEAMTGIDPAHAEAWLALGDLYAEAGENEKSAAAYGKVVALEPTNAHQIFYNLGALKVNKPDRTDADTRQAVTAFRKALEFKPDFAPALKQLAFALLGVGDRSGAREALERYVEVAPDAPDAAQVRGMIKSLQ